MADLKLTLACWTYDRTRALADGSVKPEGIALTYVTVQQVGEIMNRMLRTREFDVSELGFTYYLQSLALPERPFVAIPIFPNRIFRHSAIFVNRNSGIAHPRDLAGKKVGELHRYGHDAGIWSKGVLSDEFGVAADAYAYYVGGLDRPSAEGDWSPYGTPKHVEVHTIGAGQTLDAMLEEGEIDALYSAWVPPSFTKGSPKVGRLFENYVEVERDYFRRTGIFPIMHTVVIRRDVYEANRWVARAMMEAFQAAKDHAMRLHRIGEMFFGAPHMIPWLPALQEENRALMGADHWPYGVERNRKTLETFLRYNHEQGLTPRRYAVEEIFVPESLG
jgi:4,5-dihydroxyphthalate decarboxylase